MQRSNLAQVVLAMKKVGIQDIASFDFMDHPGTAAIDNAEATLTTLGALDNDGRLTEIGETMVELGLEPRLGRMVIEAAKPQIDCVNEICIIAAFLDGKTIFLRPADLDLAREADNAHKQFEKDVDSDFIVILNVWKAYVNSGYSAEWAQKNYLNEKSLEEAKNVRLELIDVLENQGIYIDPSTKPKINKDAIGKAVTAGLVVNLMRNGNRYSLRKVDGTKDDISIHPGSIFFNRKIAEGSLIVSDEIFTGPGGRTYACNCLEVKKEWLKEVAPEIFNSVFIQKRGRGRGRNGQSHEHHGRPKHSSSHNVFDRRSKKR
jgi:pre-mRNA-splicing factor ATP-dependent RNA helicase DHX16